MTQIQPPVLRARRVVATQRAARFAREGCANVARNMGRHERGGGYPAPALQWRRMLAASLRNVATAIAVCAAAAATGASPRPGGPARAAADRVAPIPSARRHHVGARAALFRAGHDAGLGLQSGGGCALVRGGRARGPAVRRVLLGARVGAGSHHQCGHGRRGGAAVADCAAARAGQRGVRAAAVSRADRGARRPASRSRAAPRRRSVRGRDARARAAFPRDADIATLAAEAELNLHPYDWWETDGSAKPWTARDPSLLARALRLAPDHPGANHYWIHVMETSRASRARARERRPARDAGPGFRASAAHAGAHLHARRTLRGRRRAANEASIAADRALSRAGRCAARVPRRLRRPQSSLPVRVGRDGGPHGDALAAAQAAYPAACGPRPAIAARASCSSTRCCRSSRGCASGSWREILEDTLPPDGYEPYPRAIWHYARGTAYAKTGRLAEARARTRAPRRDRRRPGAGSGSRSRTSMRRPRSCGSRG